MGRKYCASHANTSKAEEGEMAELGRAPGGKVNLCQSRLPFSSLLLKVDKPPQLFSASDVKEITHWVNTVSIGYRAVGPITDCSSHTVYSVFESVRNSLENAVEASPTLGPKRGDGMGLW